MLSNSAELAASKILIVDDPLSNLLVLKEIRSGSRFMYTFFIKDMLTNRHDAELVKTILSLGLSMGLKLVAKGVETQEHSNSLIALNCQTGQGYLYSKALSEADGIALVLSTIQR